MNLWQVDNLKIDQGKYKEFLIQIWMERKLRSKSVKKGSKNSRSPTKTCSKCLLKSINHLHIAHSLYRKYSYTQNHFYAGVFNSLAPDKTSRESTADSLDQEYLNRYHKASSRKIILNKLKESYKLLKQIPRIHIISIKEILLKCYHRKRLIEYFRLAKSLGIKVDSVAYSSFMISLKRTAPYKSFDPMLQDEYEDSCIVERELLAAIESGY